MAVLHHIPVVRDRYRRIVLDMLSGLDKGSLRLILPNGDEWTTGNGQRTTATIDIKDEAFFKRCVLFGDVGFGESYVAGDWHTNDITEVIQWFILNLPNVPGLSGSRVKRLVFNILAPLNRLLHLRRDNTYTGSRKNISRHYDLSNELFALFLDPGMTYSAAYFKSTDLTLAQAQIAKYQRLCELMALRPTDHVLEIGCGWGANAVYMAKTYGCRVTAITISEAQYKMANQRVTSENLTHLVTILLKDYRDITGRFDKVVSIEMLEAVGSKYYTRYFKKCHELLHPHGILALQVITCPDVRFKQMKKGVDWIQKHVFPGSLIPSVGAINNAVNRAGDLTLVDLRDLGQDYAATLAEWRTLFNSRVDQVRQLGLDDRFIRQWNYYLCYCEAAFRMRNIHAMQMIYTRPNNLTWQAAAH